MARALGDIVRIIDSMRVTAAPTVDASRSQWASTVAAGSSTDGH
jgi:hypothetical protein